MPVVSVLIVNFNGGGHLAACLAALGEQTLPRHLFEVVVIDNASRDGSADGLERFPFAKIVTLKTNAGFAEGNNAALRHARGAYAVLLNNDTVPDPFWLEELLRAAGPGESAASKLVFAADPTRVNSGGLYLSRDGRGADAGFRVEDAGQFEAPRPVFAGCGAAVLLPVPAGDDVLDGRYFMYYEDLDAGWRGQLAGRPAALAPRSLVRHVVGAAAGETSPLFRFCVERNRAVTSLRNGDVWLALWAGVGLLAKVPQAWLRFILMRRGHGGRHAVAVSRAFASYMWRVPRTLVERYHVRGPGVRRCG